MGLGFELRALHLQIEGEKFMRPSLKKTHHKKGLVEWLKV
jgi:hypothetical protein